MSSTSSMIFEIKAGVATLTFNRPHIGNAFDDNTIDQMSDYLVQVDKDDSIYAFVLKGAGKHFCSGADINWMRHTFEYAKEEENSFSFAKLLHHLSHMSKPTIAAAHGATLGGGIGFIACCDIVLAATDATFCFSEVKLGLVPAVVGPYVIQAIGPHQAKSYILSAEPFSADKACQMGLIHKVVPLAALETELDLLLENLHKHGPKAMLVAKGLVHKLSEEPDPANELAYTAHLITALRASKEAQEGLTAFLEKRPPKWR